MTAKGKSRRCRDDRVGKAHDAKGLAARIEPAEEPGGVSQTCAKRQTFLDAAVVASRVEAAHLLSRASQ